MTQPKFKIFTVKFKTGRNHLSQEIKITTINKAIALEMAKNEILSAYGSEILKNTLFI